MVWPALVRDHRGRVALAWVWLAAILLAIPVLYGIASTLATAGPQNLVPSAEAAYAGGLALFAMCFFSIMGLVHRRREASVFERRATWLSAGSALLLTVAIGLAFVLVAVVNDQALRGSEPVSSRFGPTDPDLATTVLRRTLAAGPQRSRQPHGRLQRRQRRLGRSAAARSAKWSGRDLGCDRGADPRSGARTPTCVSGRWPGSTTNSDDPDSAGHAWQETQPDLFGLMGTATLTMDGPPHASVDVPRGSIVAEDLGLECIEGARARHCRTFIDGPTALDTFLPLRWLLDDSSERTDDPLRHWRGQMDWWVFGDGELGMARVEVSGSASATPWQTDGVRAVLEARLESVSRDRSVDITRPFEDTPTDAATALPRAIPSPSPSTTLPTPGAAGSLPGAARITGVGSNPS